MSGVASRSAPLRDLHEAQWIPGDQRIVTSGHYRLAYELPLGEAKGERHGNQKEPEAGFHDD
jgi:hypothetical protein